MLTLTTAALALAAQGTPAATCTLGWIAGDRRDPRVWIARAPSPGARRIARLEAGSAVLLCAQKGAWVLIRFADGGHSCGGLGGGAVRPPSTCAEGWIETRRVRTSR